MAKKHANKKPKKKGKVIKMSNEQNNPKQEEKLSPEEAMTKLVDQFKSGTTEQRENILFNMNMRMGQALDGLNARLDMLAGVVYKMPGVQDILAKMQEEQQKAMEAKEKEGENNGQPEPSKEGATPESV